MTKAGGRPWAARDALVAATAKLAASAVAAAANADDAEDDAGE